MCPCMGLCGKTVMQRETFLGKQMEKRKLKTGNMKQETDAEEKTENRWSRGKKILWCPLAKTIFCTGWCPSTIAMVLLNENKTGGELQTQLCVSSATLPNVWHGVKHIDVGGMYHTEMTLLVMGW